MMNDGLSLLRSFGFFQKGSGLRAEGVSVSGFSSGYATGSFPYSFCGHSIGFLSIF